MQASEDLAAVRHEIVYLLRQQMDALDSPAGLTDARLSECYERQARVQELREKLQAAATHSELVSTSREPSTAQTSLLNAAAGL